MKWKLFTRDENHSPPVEGPEIKQHDTEKGALEAAYKLRGPPIRQPHQGHLHCRTGSNSRRLRPGVKRGPPGSDARRFSLRIH